MVKLGEPIRSPLEVANDLATQGLQVFPARYRDKMPIVKWQQFQDTDSHHMLDVWFKNKGSLNYWVMTGRLSGYVVIDCDSPEGDAFWRKHLGDKIMDDTAIVKTAKGKHYWFKLDQPLASWGTHPNPDRGDTFKESFDVRADGTGVIAPPSIHENGKAYRWLRTLRHALPAPAPLLDGSVKKKAPRSAGNTAETTGTGGQARSMLTKLLAKPPGGAGSGRNDWLARVAGHYAKTYHNQRDLYEAHCHTANVMMGTPLDDKEYNKTIDSVWRGEHERNTHRSIDAACGFLASGGTRLECQVAIKRGENTEYAFAEYADFDLTAKGVMTDEAGRRTYWAEIVRRDRAGSDGSIERRDVILRAEVLGDDRAFRKFLAGYACTVVPPDNMFPRTGSPGIRIQRYLESQRPPVVEITPALGFHASALGEGRGGYVTHDGVISADGLHGLDEAKVRADPRLASGGTAPHAYGFAENEVIARDTLEQILTFHDETVTAVYGAWWAACLLKPQIEQFTSLFPFMAIEAPSESGKTNGYFQMMNQLNGNTRGETQPTKAALRDMAAAHRNGIVWVDDLDDPAYLMELLRAATSGGSLTKMGEDRESVKNTQIVSPIVISGEALGLGTQKALIDRAILLKAGSPTSRRSFSDPSRPQWDDVLAVRERFPHLADLAGWYVQDALGAVDKTLACLAEGRTGGSGRSADKVAVLRAGARLLDYLVRHDGAWAGRGEYARRVEAWVRRTLVDDTGVAIVSNENALTLELLPWALRKWKMPDKASAGDKIWESDTPAFVRGYDPKEFVQTTIDEDDGITVHFNVALLSEAWAKDKYGRVEKRTTTENALTDQAQALGAKAKRVKISQSGGRLAYYYELNGPVAAAVVRRAIGK